MLAQRRLREGFDVALLHACIETALDDTRFKDGFLIRKAIGWTRRERPSAAPDEVLEYCSTHAARLSPLSRHEALRVIERRRGRVAPDA